MCKLIQFQVSNGFIHFDAQYVIIETTKNGFMSNG